MTTIERPTRPNADRLSCSSSTGDGGTLPNAALTPHMMRRSSPLDAAGVLPDGPSRGKTVSTLRFHAHAVAPHTAAPLSNPHS